MKKIIKSYQKRIKHRYHDIWKLKTVYSHSRLYTSNSRIFRKMKNYYILDEIKIDDSQKYYHIIIRMSLASVKSRLNYKSFYTVNRTLSFIRTSNRFHTIDNLFKLKKDVMFTL